MAKGKRKVPDINSSSTADIAFLLLIFFLITTSMDTDRGLARLLPPPPEDEKNENTDKIKERNILQVYLNKDDALMCGNDYIGVDQLRQKAKEFIANINNAENMPEKTQKNVDFFGTTLVNDKHVISLQNDRGSSYQAYISVQNELVAAYNELRDELAQEKFGVTYAELNDAQQKAVREVYPQRISEAEPKKYGEKKKCEMPALNTSSLPDLIFTLLFFFMIVTTMREVTLKVQFTLPQGTELEKLEKKSLVTFIYVGEPTQEYRAKMGTESRIQLNDSYAEVGEVQDFIFQERASMNEGDAAKMTVSLKVDQKTKMGIVTDVKNALRKSYALKINYSATKRGEK